MPAMRRSVHHAVTTALLTAALLAPPAARAFGPAGHRVAGHIAEQHLCAETRVALKPLLAGMPLADAGLWPDWIRQLPEWEHTKPWHYLNVSDRGSIARAARQNPDNVLVALERFEQELADTSLGDQRRGQALRFVVHFVVDLHQPLHVGRATDRGGTLIPVVLAGRTTTLHAVWDGEQLAPAGPRNARERAALLPDPPAAERRRWLLASPVDWARESQALRPQVYDYPDPGGLPVALPAAYLERARASVDQRLIMAGIRLAGRLNALLGGLGGCDAEVASR
ncbi:MAG: hypothetical protein EXR82_01125 [Gammaproteobacteria bacterium]|nr:hypothetical protein [Gammaproteobacteria bacterium]